MPRSPCNFRESDVRRVVKAARSSGIEIGRVEIDSINGRIAIFPQDSTQKNEAASLDDWMEKHAGQA